MNSLKLLIPLSILMVLGACDFKTEKEKEKEAKATAEKIPAWPTDPDVKRRKEAKADADLMFDTNRKDDAMTKIAEGGK